MTRRVTAHCCLAQDYERDLTISDATIRWAAISTMALWDAETLGMLT